MLKYIFITAFIISIFSQLYTGIYPLTDDTIWAGGAKSLLTESPINFKNLDVYIHPGGTVLEGTILFHRITNATFPISMNAFLILATSMLIAIICTFSYFLRKDPWWTFITFGILTTATYLYGGLTPPSLLASLLFVLFELYTLYIYESEDHTWPQFIIWSLLAGSITATRIDIGGFAVVANVLFLMHKVNIKPLLASTCLAGIFFCILDPFMWFSPINQIQTLILTMINHHAGIGGFSIPIFLLWIQFTAIYSILGVLFGIILVLFRKEISYIIPVEFIIFLLISTAVLTGVVLTAQSQANRYLQPLVFLWEILFPLFLFSIISDLHFSLFKNEKTQTILRIVLKVSIVLLLILPQIFTIYAYITKNGFSAPELTYNLT